MNNEATTQNAKPSNLKWVWAALAGAILCLGLCGITAFLLVRANVTRAIPMVTATLPRDVDTQELPGVPTLMPMPSENVGSMHLQAVNLMYQGKFEEARQIWDEIIGRAPERDTAYYQRAVCYYNLAGQQHSLQQHDLYVRMALADMDQAISMQPTNGDYYAFRHDVWAAVMETEEYRVNRQAIARIAHEDVKAAIALGYSDAYPYTDRAYAIDLRILEQCEDSLAETERILKSTPAEDSSITGLYRMQAQANACLGNFEAALQGIEASLHNPHYVLGKTYEKAAYLYQLGRLEEALTTITGSLDSQPTFEGYRYYLRALIRYDLGETELANQDLEIGSIYTWEQAGLSAYVSGKMALDEGRREEGIQLLQQAEATLDADHMLIRWRIIEELARLGAKPLSLTPSITFVTTPIPINQP